ncbi:MAG TPA: transporter [Thermoanaerobaculia bacterium]|nr:transporter [Thermoanaerobaculia bacterium]
MTAAIRILFLAFFALPALAQIQDNSFLTEEAYNQDPGVVQHISIFQRDRLTDQWTTSFTQEWPAPGLKHQLSYGVGTAGSRFTDLALNYRYQLLGDAEARLAMAPRFTVTLPTGRWREGVGNGAIGYQGALATSLVLAPHWQTHFDVGAGYVPHAHDPLAGRRDLPSVNLGHNLVWLPANRINFMLETVFSRARGFDGWENQAFVSPGVRWSYDFPSGLQIVPGIGVPIGVGPSAGERSVLLYLSFEHRFRAQKN